MRLRIFDTKFLLIAGLLMALSMIPVSGFAQSVDATLAYRAAEEARKAAETPEDMQAVIEAYTELAKADHPRSAFRLGNIYFRGTLTEQDPDRGIAYYRQAADLGYDVAYRYLGNALLKVGEGEAALAAFDKAAEAGVEGFELSAAKAHLRGGFGELSDPEAGVEALKQLATTGNVSARIELAKAYANPKSGFADFDESRELLEPLVAEGNAIAMEQLARIYRGGLGVQRSYPRANDLYLKAEEAGLSRAALRAAEIEIRRGKTNTALTRLQAAMAQDVEDADLALAAGHLSGSFGRQSDPALGIRMVKDGIAADDLDFKLLALNLLSDGRRLVVDTDALMADAEKAADGGLDFAAETLVRFTREKARLVPKAWAKRTDYLERYADIMRDKRLAEERVYYILDGNPPAKARQILLERLPSLSDDEYYYSMVTAAKADRNAYTYLLQKEMASIGAYRGRANGYMTRRTVRSALSFCRAEGYFDDCKHGPLTSAAVQLMVASLVEKRRLMN